MERRKAGYKKKNGTYRWIFVVFIVICILASVFSFLYYRNLHKTIREESRGYLQEVSRRVAANLDRITKDNFAMLNMMGASLEATEPETMEEVRRLLQKQQGFGEFETIMLVEESGKAYNIADSKSVFFSFDGAMLDSMLANKSAIAKDQIMDNKEYFVFAVSLDHVVVGGEKIMALAACYDPDTLNQVLSMTSFNGQAYSQIITKSGTLVTKAVFPFAMKSGYNIFSTLQNAEMDEKESLTKVCSDIENNVADQISFSLDGVHRYMVYTPIQPDDWYLLTFVPFQAVNEKSDMLLVMTLRICGLLVILFCGLVAILFWIFRANKKKLERLAYVDGITEGNTIQRFYELAAEMMESVPEQKYALVYTNIENFKILNAQIGRKNCDMILTQFYKYSSSVLNKNECMGRLFADNFCIMLTCRSEEELIKRFEDWSAAAEEYFGRLNPAWGMPQLEFGVYVIENKDMPFPEMIDRAKLALRESPRQAGSKLRYAFYDDAARSRMFREKHLSDVMEEALKNREFQVYLQPKYRLPEEKIGGAEALVRWCSSTEGMIYPDEFIPLFEKNGFVVTLDLWVFEEVCRTLCSWIERGVQPVKISVNCSRVHFKNEKFLQAYLTVADQYQIDRSLIEIELTESVVFEDTERLIKIIEQIRAAGFGCSMDDFGSGYSSLNLIQSIPVDTLKIDKVFFKDKTMELDRLKAVVGGIIRMSHSLSMVTVAEGVEYREQVEMLKQEGCDYIQGYIFDKPMNIASFEQKAFGESLAEVRKSDPLGEPE